VPRRYVPRRHSDEAEQESAPVGASAPVAANELGDARLTELLIMNGPERLNGGRAVPPTSVARLQRLAGNRAVADRLGSRVRVQRVPEDEEIESTAQPAEPAAEPVSGGPGPEDPGHEVLPEAGEI